MFGRKIIILDDILSIAECNGLIKHFNDSRDKVDYQGTHYVTLTEADYYPNRIVKRINNLANKLLEKEIYIDWTNVVQWPVGSDQKAHYDLANPNTVFTSITYLNDNYSGGKTFFVNDLEVVPKTGRTLFFDGNYYEHGVSEITNDTRYTLAIWYKL